MSTTQPMRDYFISGVAKTRHASRLHTFQASWSAIATPAAHF
jgi:hypothetical protein